MKWSLDDEVFCCCLLINKNIVKCIYVLYALHYWYLAAEVRAWFCLPVYREVLVFLVVCQFLDHL